MNNYPGGAVVVTGFLAWQNFPGSTATDQANAVSSRNSLLFSLQNGSGVTALSATFNGIALDCACNPFYADNNGNPQTINVAGIPFATCTTQAETGNSDTSGAVGLDNGKICPSGPAYIVAANPQTSSNLAGTGAGITCTKGNGGTFTCAATVELSTQVLNNLQTGQSISINLAGVSTGGTCTSAEQTANLAVLNAGTFSLTAVDANTGDQKTFSFTSNTLTCAGSGATFTVDASSGSDTFTITGAWSPLCDNSFSFYQANNALSSSPQPSIGYICPACQTTSGSNTILFTYAGQ